MKFKYKDLIECKLSYLIKPVGGTSIHNRCRSRTDIFISNLFLNYGFSMVNSFIYYYLLSSLEVKVLVLIYVGYVLFLIKNKINVY